MQSYFRILERDERRGGMAVIEAAGRVCGSSGGSLGPGNAERFVANCIRGGQEAMLAHGDYIFTMEDRHIYDNVAEDLQMIRDMGYPAPMLEMTCIHRRPIVSGNIRAWRELFGFGALAGAYFIGHMDPIYTRGFYDTGAEPDPRVRQIFYADLEDRLEKLAHQRHTVFFSVDPGAGRGFAGQRAMGLTQESARCANGGSVRCANCGSARCANGGSVRCANDGSARCANGGSVRCANCGSVRCANDGSVRYANCGSARYANCGSARCANGGSVRCANGGSVRRGSETGVAGPLDLAQAHGSRRERGDMGGEGTGARRLCGGHLPGEASGALSNGAKAEWVVTGNLRSWQRYFDLHARQMGAAAHPQAALAMPLYEVDKRLFPGAII